MDKIICLVGESGSGKSTIAERLEKEGYNYIQSYTTRKRRHKGEKGHIFVDTVPTIIHLNFFGEGEIRKSNIIAYAFYNYEYYWATKEQYQGKGTSIYVIDPAGIKYLKEKVTDTEIVVIYLKCDEEKRYKRIFARAKSKLNTQDKDYKMKFNKCCLDSDKRIINDREAFKIVECNYTIDANRPVKEVLKDVKNIIEGEEI